MPETIDNRKVFSLLEVTKSIEKAISRNYTGSYWIKAEMVKLNYFEKNGHCYPDIAEKKNGVIVAQIKAIIWKNTYEKINNKFKTVTKDPLKDGLTILFLTKVKFDSLHGLALHILDIDPNYTLGELARMKMEAIQKLKEEKIFDQNKKIPFPLLPQRIAVISVETSKGYSDFCSKIDHNSWGYKFFHMLFPSLLQGEKATIEIITQLARIRLVAHHFDVVAIIRGGGGDVGLNCFDDYNLAKTIAFFPLPVLTGIGHSTNETVAEMVSARNNITPTDLADFLIQQFHNFSVPVKNSIRAVTEYAERLLKEEDRSLMNCFKMFKTRIESNVSLQNNSLDNFWKIISIRPLQIIQDKLIQLKGLLGYLEKDTNYKILSFIQIINQKKDKIFSIVNQNIKSSEMQLEQFIPLLELHVKNQLKESGQSVGKIERIISVMDPKNVLQRGYSLTWLNGKILKLKEDVKKGDQIETDLSDGKIISIVESK